MGRRWLYAKISVMGSPPWEIENRPTGQVRKHHLRIDAQEMVHRGDQVAGRDGPFGRVGSEFVAGTQYESFFDPAPEEQCETALGPVVAAGLAVNAGSASHLAHDDDHRGLQQPAPIEVFDQGRTDFIEVWQIERFEHREVLLVRIPVARASRDSVVTPTKVTPASTNLRATSKLVPKSDLP